MNNYTRILSDKISYLRKANGLTQEALAEKVGLSFQAISKWENGQSSPDITLLPVIAEIFGVHIDELFGKEIVMQPHFDLVSDLPWLDDENIRGVIFKGHKILDKCEEISKFTFKYNGEALNVISHCNIECSKIQNGANAAYDVNCNGEINGGATAGADINCGNITGNVDADAGVNCGNVGCSVDAGQGVNCGNVGCSVDAGQQVYCGNIDGSVECTQINCGNVNGSVECGGNITCEKIFGDIKCDGDIIYKK